MTALKQEQMLPQSQLHYQKSLLKAANQSRLNQSLANNIKPLSPDASADNEELLPAHVETESERIKHCGSLFDRRSTMNQDLLQEFFRREPCPYGESLRGAACSAQQTLVLIGFFFSRSKNLQERGQNIPLLESKSQREPDFEVSQAAEQRKQPRLSSKPASSHRGTAH